MSKVVSPPEKKRLAYERDHYNRGGESDKAWRKTKPHKKAKARRAFRKASNDLLRICSGEPEAAPGNAVRKQTIIEQKQVVDWGVIPLREFVATRRGRNQTDAGTKKTRQLRRSVF